MARCGRGNMGNPGHTLHWAPRVPGGGGVQGSSSGSPWRTGIPLVSSTLGLGERVPLTHNPSSTPSSPPQPPHPQCGGAGSHLWPSTLRESFMREPPTYAEGAAEGQKVKGAVLRDLGTLGGKQACPVSSRSPALTSSATSSSPVAALSSCRAAGCSRSSWEGAKGDPGDVGPCGVCRGSSCSVARAHPPGLRDEQKPSTPCCAWKAGGEGSVRTSQTTGVTEPCVKTHSGGSVREC